MSLMQNMYVPIQEQGFWADNAYVVGNNPWTVTVAEINRETEGRWAIIWFGYATVSKGVSLGGFLSRSHAADQVERLVTEQTVLAP